MSEGASVGERIAASSSPTSGRQPAASSPQSKSKKRRLDREQEDEVPAAKRTAKDEPATRRGPGALGVELWALLPFLPFSFLAIIGMFNYKGGVGKSTNAMNIGVALACLKHKTLLVDSDSQCNLTSYFLEKGDEASDDDDEEAEQHFAAAVAQTRVRGVLKLDTVKKNTIAVKVETAADESNLHAQLSCAFDGDLEKLKAFAATSPIPIRDRLWLVPGSPHIVKYEAELVVAQHGRKYVSTVGGFRKFLLLAAESIAAEFVIVDFGPSAGFMNETFVMSCDYIFPPSFADRLSLSSVSGLVNSVLPRWYSNYSTTLKTLDTWLSRQDDRVQTEQRAFQLPVALPKLLPLLITGYRMRKDEIVAGSSSWVRTAQFVMNNLPASVQSRLVLINEARVLPFLRGLEAPLKLAHKVRKALISLTEEDFVVQHDDRRGYALVEEAILRYESLAKILAEPLLFPGREDPLFNNCSGTSSSSSWTSKPCQ